MMHQYGRFPVADIKRLKAFVIELPYGDDNRFSMLILMPHQGATLANVFDRLKSYTALHTFNKNACTDIRLALPLFRLTSARMDIRSVLQRMGIRAFFDETRSGYIRRIAHKVDLAVDEAGTTPGDATNSAFAGDRETNADSADSVEATFDAIDSAIRRDASSPEIVINKPFGVVIIDRSMKSILFAGQVRDPSQRSRKRVHMHKL